MIYDAKPFQRPSGYPSSPPVVVCLAQQNWDVALRTNRQRISQAAAAAGYLVLYVETNTWLGTSLRELRGRRRAVNLVRSSPTRDGVRVRRAVNPVPFSWRYAGAAMFNARVERRIIDAELARLGWDGEQTWLVYDPRGIEIAAGSDGRIIYDCVDDHAAQQRDRKLGAALTRFDRRATELADRVVVTSEGLAIKKRADRPDLELVPNVADVQAFSRAKRPQGKPARHPVIGFVGSLDAYKLDFDMLGAAADLRPEWTFRCFGPVAASSASEAARLEARPNVEFAGVVDHAALPSLVVSLDAAVIPYVANEYTASCFPLKLYEYLAAGLPVTVAGLPSVPSTPPDISHADSVQAFVSALEAQMADRSAVSDARRRQLASGNTWESRAAAVLQFDLASSVSDE